MNLVHRASVHEANEDFEASVKDFQAAIELDSENQQVYFRTCGLNPHI